MDLDSTVNYPVVAPWKLISDVNRGVMIGVRKDEIYYHLW